MNHDESMMAAAIEVCRSGIGAGQSPFGAVVATRDGTIVAATHNTVRLTCDATAHAEVNAIRAACQALGTIDLAGHVLYTTCEPCPMCAAAIHWARLDEVVFGATIADADKAGFNELHLACTTLYTEGGSKVIVRGPVSATECATLFDEWKAGSAATPY